MLSKVIWWVKLFVAIVLILTAMVIMVQADETVPFENLHIKQALPDYCYDMPRPLYEKWCDMQNRGAYRQAERLADIARARNPLKETYTQENEYKARVAQTQKEKVSPNSASMTGNQDTTYKGKGIQNVYQSGQAAGGPVVVLNPYAPRPAVILFAADGTPYVADPDKTLDRRGVQQMLDRYMARQIDCDF